ncbi:MAG: NAD(P)H-binding protein [Paludibacteraceae bacterium]
MNKKVLIIGASGSLAKVVIDTLKKQSDMELTLFVRNKNRISNAGNPKVIEGDAMNYSDVKNAISGQNIVYVNLAGDLDTMSKNIVKAMQEKNVKRIIAISSIGIFDTPLKSVLKPYRALSDNIEDSDLDYTILRPDWFTNGNEVDYEITHKGKPEIGGALSRKSIADFIGKLVKNPQEHVRENLGISRV